MADFIGPKDTIVWAGVILLAVGILFGLMAPESYRRNPASP